ncbi:MAG: hypothetical protein WKF75_13940 [Singulisphaera sp.]
MDDPTAPDPQPTRSGGGGETVMAEGTDAGVADPARGTSAGDRMIGGPDQGATIALGTTFTPVGGDAGATGVADPPHDAADPGGLTIADATTTPVPRRATPSIPGYEVLHELGRGVWASSTSPARPA